MFKFLLSSVFILSFSGGREAIRLMSQNQELFTKISEEKPNYECTCTNGDNFKTFTFHPNDNKFNFISSLFENPTENILNLDTSRFEPVPENKGSLIQNLIKSVGLVLDKPNDQNGLLSSVMQILNNGPNINSNPNLVQNVVKKVESILPNLNNEQKSYVSSLLQVPSIAKTTELKNPLQQIQNYFSTIPENKGIILEKVLSNMYPNLNEDQSDYFSTKFQLPKLEQNNYETCEIPAFPNIPLYNTPYLKGTWNTMLPNIEPIKQTQNKVETVKVEVPEEIPGNINYQPFPNYEIAVPTETGFSLKQVPGLPEYPVNSINQMYTIPNLPQFSGIKYKMFKYPGIDWSTVNPTFEINSPAMYNTISTGSIETQKPNPTQILLNNGNVQIPSQTIQTNRVELSQNTQNVVTPTEKVEYPNNININSNNFGPTIQPIEPAVSVVPANYNVPGNVNTYFTPEAPKISVQTVQTIPSNIKENINLNPSFPGTNMNVAYTTGTMNGLTNLNPVPLNPGNINVQQIYPVGNNNGVGQLNPVGIITGQYSSGTVNPGIGVDVSLNPGNLIAQQLYPTGNTIAAGQIIPVGITGGQYSSVKYNPGLSIDGTLNPGNLNVKPIYPSGNIIEAAPINPVVIAGQYNSGAYNPGMVGSPGNVKMNPGMYQYAAASTNTLGIAVGAKNSERPNFLSNLPNGNESGPNNKSGEPGKSGELSGNINGGNPVPNGNPAGSSSPANLNSGTTSPEGNKNSADLNLRASLPNANANINSNVGVGVPNANIAGSLSPGNLNVGASAGSKINAGGSLNAGNSNLPGGNINAGVAASGTSNTGNPVNNPQISASSGSNGSPGLLNKLATGIDNGIKTIGNAVLPSRGSDYGVNANANVNVNTNANGQPHG